MGQKALAGGARALCESPRTQSTSAKARAEAGEHDAQVAKDASAFAKAASMVALCGDCLSRDSTDIASLFVQDRSGDADYPDMVVLFLSHLDFATFAFNISHCDREGLRHVRGGCRHHVGFAIDVVSLERGSSSLWRTAALKANRPHRSE